MTSRGRPVKYLRCDNAGKHQSKLHRACKKNVTLEYMVPHKTQMIGFIERRFAVIKKGASEMLLNAKLNETAQKILWVEAVHTCKCIRNGMENAGITTRPFGNVYGENSKIIGSFSEFVRIGYVT